jgi:hypothetical protein
MNIIIKNENINLNFLLFQISLLKMYQSAGLMAPLNAEVEADDLILKNCHNCILVNYINYRFIIRIIQVNKIYMCNWFSDHKFLKLYS